MQKERKRDVEKNNLKSKNHTFRWRKIDLLSKIDVVKEIRENGKMSIGLMRYELF